MTSVHDRGWSASLFIKGMDPEAPVRPHRFREILFLSEER